MDSRSLLHALRNVTQPLLYQVDCLEAEARDDASAKTARAFQDSFQLLELFLSRAEVLARPLELASAPVDLESLLQSSWCDACARVPAQQAPAFDVRARNVPAAVSCDEYWLRQALIELFQNSIEAGAKRVSVRIEAQGPRVLITLEDDGRGVEDSLRGNLFAPFVTSKPAAGAGLGLPIARKIVEAHGGTLDVSSDAGATRAQLALANAA